MKSNEKEEKTLNFVKKSSALNSYTYTKNYSNIVRYVEIIRGLVGQHLL